MSRDPKTFPAHASAPAVLEMQARWISISIVIGSAAWGLDLWSRSPAWCLASATIIGALAIQPRTVRWMAPVLSGAWLVGGVLDEANLSTVLAAGASAGLATGMLLRPEIPGRIRIHLVLACTAGSGLGLMAAAQAHPDLVGTLEGAWTAILWTAIGTSSGLWMLYLGLHRGLPTRRDVERSLLPEYRPPVFKALDIHADAVKWAGQVEDRMGLDELVRWTWDLQSSLQSMDQQLTRMNIADIEARRSAVEPIPFSDDVTRTRYAAMRTHLDRLTEHYEALSLERKRTAVHVDYALAFLEEARAGLAIARELPADALPEGLPEVLQNLRNHAQHADARRRTARELQSVP